MLMPYGAKAGMALNGCMAGTMDILLVEDNPGDARLAAEAFKEGTVPTQLHVVQDGIEAMAFLRREPPFDTGATPGSSVARPQPASQGRT